MLKKKVWRIPVWLIAVLAIVTIAAAAILYLQSNPLTGSAVVFDVSVTQAETNDDGDGGGSQPDAGWDPKDNSTGKHAWNIAECLAVPNLDGNIDFAWSDVYFGEDLFCIVQLTAQNDGSEDLTLIGLSVVDSPVILDTVPDCGTKTAAAGAPVGFHFIMQVDQAALEADGWTDGEIVFEWGISDSVVCP